MVAVAEVVDTLAVKEKVMMTLVVTSWKFCEGVGVGVWVPEKREEIVLNKPQYCVA